MTENLSQEFHRTLLQQMTDRKFLKEAGIRKKQMMEILRQVEWDLVYEEIFEKDSLVSCRKVAEVCAVVTERLGNISGQKLLQYVYDWTKAAMFPENFQVEKKAEFEKARMFYCQLLRIFLEMEKTYKKNIPTRHFGLLPYDISDEEDAQTGREYQIFLDVMKEQYMMEFYRIAAEITPFDTLGHVAGVHYVAMHVAKQLKKIGKPIDLKLMSAAAALHDIGKFGCRENELRRIPYLHYYYSDVYTRRFEMPLIGHIAVNHSTWDLELEDLSVENLILIYADFRVKSTRGEDGKEIVHFYSLKESFDVILNKLDNVDEKKSNRYRMVYAKLKDFEDYMEDHGVNTDLTKEEPEAISRPDFVLMNQNEAVRQIKYTAIEHNIFVMTRMNSERSLRNILEAARSEKNWRNIRAYINIFEEYFTYMNEKQTNMTLQYLFELLFHTEVDIRRQASYLCGKIIANYDQEYRKELPEDVEPVRSSTSAVEVLRRLIEAVLFPDHSVTEQHRKWLGFCLRRIIRSVHTECREEEGKKFLRVFLDFFLKCDYKMEPAFILLNAAGLIRFEMLEEREVLILLRFAKDCTRWEGEVEQLQILQFLRSITRVGIWTEQLRPFAAEILEKTGENTVLKKYIGYKLRMEAGMEIPEREATEEVLFKNENLLSQVFLENLKVATRGTVKKANIELLIDSLKWGDPVRVSRIAIHFSNLFTASRRLMVREHAGEQLVQMMPLLSSDQRNEIVIEMAESLGSGEFQYVRYIPQYLGKMAMYLYPDELDELVNDTLAGYINGSDMKAVMYTLHTLGVIVEHYPEYLKYGEPEEVYRKRRRILLGLLMKGMSHYQEDVSVEALTVIGHEIFGSRILTVEEKKEIFSDIQKQLLCVIGEQSQEETAFFGRASALSRIYSFITEYEFYYGTFEIKDNPKIAFFPGTFDPFSIGHKEIVRAVRKLGFEVYLAVDEFSWSKKTQPKLIRRKIMQMSVADMGGVYLFPDDIPINIANPNDMKLLHDLFAGKDLYLTAGADVIANASAYQKDVETHSVHNCNHIIFSRGNVENELEDIVREKVLGKVIRLELDHSYDGISSSKIRENIDRNRDISNLVDPLAQKYIYHHSLYLREPQYKKSVIRQSIRIQMTEDMSGEQKEEFICMSEKENMTRCGLIGQIKEQDCAVWMTDEQDHIIGAVFYREVPTGNLFEEFRDMETVRKIRKLASGKLVVLYGLFIHKDNASENNLEHMLTEVFAGCLKEGFTHMVVHLADRTKKIDPEVEQILFRHGFVRICNEADNLDVYLVDMRFPMVVIQNTEIRIKEPFNTNKNVQNVLIQTQKHFLEAMTELYPGSLVVSFDSLYMSYRMLELITAENHVPSGGSGTTLGDKMCIPYDKIMRDVVIPNTVTKAIYTEKIYTSDASDFWIAQYPGYSPLKTQIRTIASFSRPVILADDILHKGDRLKKLYPMLQEGDIKVDKLVVGILSGHGTDLAAMEQIPVDSVYFIPNLRAWFTEANMYPFLGGDYIEKTGRLQARLLPSLNQILPYTVPQFLENITWNDYYDFSMACLQNALDLFRVLEEEYQSLYQRNLTLGRLSEVLREAYCPDQGEHMDYDMQMSASVYIENDILKMKRLKNMTD